MQALTEQPESSCLPKRQDWAERQRLLRQTMLGAANHKVRTVDDKADVEKPPL